VKIMSSYDNTKAKTQELQETLESKKKELITLKSMETVHVNKEP